ncbi:MAG: prepilin-type N-terminal cleavage/methylation domain-containing protein [Planctomycetota bacterium]
MSRLVPNNDPRGVTLLEVMTSLAIASTLMTASMVVLRSNYAVWTVHETELDRAGAANAVLRRIVRGVRQSVSVVAITPASQSSGALTLEQADGTTESWTHASGAVTYRVNSDAEQTLSDAITSLVLEGYEADGTTLTTVPADVHSIRCTVTTTAPTGGARSASSYAWLRAW